MPTATLPSQMEVDDYQIENQLDITPTFISNSKPKHHSNTRKSASTTRLQSDSGEPDTLEFNTPSRQSNPQFGATSQLPSERSVHRSTARL